MKNMIITFGIVVFILTISSMQLSCNEMLKDEQDLKFAADEAAATAVLCLNKFEFGNGNITFNKKTSERRAREITRVNLRNKDFKLALRYLEGETPAVEVWLRQGKLKAHSKYEYVSY